MTTNDYYAVTTFSQAGFQCYGRNFIETFLGNWDIDLICHYEGKEPPRLSHSRLLWESLDADKDRADFIQKYSGPAYNFGPRYPNAQAVRFCHKVFAVTVPKREGRMLWIDADVETFAPVNQDALHDFLPLDASLSFLGREGVIKYSECGFVGYNLNDPKVVAMVAEMRKLYVTGDLFKRRRNCWHDSATFDWARGRSGISSQQQVNLTRDENGINPWPCSVLGKYMRHNKGIAPKIRAYGGVVD